MPFKKGAFHVAIDSQIPIQPVVVSKYYYINHNLKRFNSGNNVILLLFFFNNCNDLYFYRLFKFFI